MHLPQKFNFSFKRTYVTAHVALETKMKFISVFYAASHLGLVFKTKNPRAIRGASRDRIVPGFWSVSAGPLDCGRVGQCNELYCVDIKLDSFDGKKLNYFLENKFLECKHSDSDWKF